MNDGKVPPGIGAKPYRIKMKDGIRGECVIASLFSAGLDQAV